MNLNNTKISTRLILGFGLLILMMTLMGGASIVNNRSVDKEFGEVIHDFYPKVQTVKEVEENLDAIALAMRSMVIAAGTTDAKSESEAIKVARQTIVARLEELEKGIVTKEGKAVFAKVVVAREAYIPLQEKALTLIAAGRVDEARATMLGDLRQRLSAYRQALDDLAKHEVGLMDEAAAQAHQAIAASERTVWVSSAIALLVAALMSAWIIRSITVPINNAVGLSRAVAAGDLSRQFEVTGQNETAQLLRSLKDMQTNLAKVVGGVRQNAEGVASASSQIAQGNQDLSQRTEEQASALEETAASMEQLGTTVKQNAEHALQANQLAIGASTVAIKGGEVVGEVVTTMKGINDSSKRIADIISVIDGIAFQTNILALNAAVEAARAGEQGRGFAVVASEVRNLAGRSAEAAKEIKSLITTSVERVERGTALVDQAGATMTEVVSAIQRVTQIMGEISAASAEQSAGVTQVGEAVSQMDQVTQQNAALVEEGAAAAASLNSQAHALVESVAFFNLGQQAATPTAPAPATPMASSVASPFVERRGPNRATNVMRPKFGAKASTTLPAKSIAPAAATKTGTDDWESF
jgi:methyl-accepting chemotaxis protein